MDPQGHVDRVIADTNSILHEAQSWMGRFLSADAEKNNVINVLLEELRQEQSKIAQLTRDLQAEYKLRNNYQVEVEQFQTSFQKLNQKIAEGSFVTVLIDGDGAKFADRYLKSPMEGAPQAAQALKQEIRDYLKDEMAELSDDIPILIRVYANLNDLAKSLRISNVIDRDEDMKLFAEQLTNSRTEIDFVNVGRGKENADSKLRKMLSHYLKNVQCKTVFVACCHDNGYLHDLREYSDQSELRKRVVLLETTPAEPGFRRLGFPILRWDSVFKMDTLGNETKHPPLVTMPPSNNRIPPHNGVPTSITHFDSTVQRTPAMYSPELPLRSVPTPPSIDSPPPASMVEVEPRVARTPSVVNSGNGGTSISYATAGGSQDHQNITIKSTKLKKQPKVIYYNVEGHRIDPPTKHPSNTPSQPTYQEKLAKVAPNAFCNDHYLTGRCRRPNCERIHNVELTPGEISIHRYKARTSVCPRGPECDQYDCYLSHHCLKDPRCTRGSACKFSNTEWGDLHLDSDEKLRPVTKWTEGDDFPETVA